MEHRQEVRTRVAWEVVVKTGIGLIHTQAKNISRHGIMLGMGRLALTIGKVVELHCIVSRARRHHILRAQAQVVHFRNGWAGLMWTGRGPDAALIDSMVEHARRHMEKAEHTRSFGRPKLIGPDTGPM